MCKYLIKVCLLHNRIRDWCNPRQSPSPTGSAAGNPRDEKKHELFHILALLRNLFGGSYGFDVSSQSFGKVLGK